jgi:tetratricopeptide (TPR) repeat protein
MSARISGSLARRVMLTMFVLAASGVSFAQDSATAARNLYAAAAYEDALALFDRLRAGGSAQSDPGSVEQYRAYCLLALGREAEAVRVIEGIVEAQPQFEPASADISPRVRLLFQQVRQRVLPRISQQAYTDAKAAFDRKEYEAASHQFDRVLSLLTDPDLVEASSRPPLSDLRSLATGFRDLSVANTPPPPPLAPAPAPEVPAPPPPVRVYGPTDTTVVPPVVLRQALPPLPRGVVIGGRVGVDVLIDEAGAVERVSLRGTVDPSYASVALETAKDWRYKPATLDGVPVKYRKVVQVNVQRPPA